MSAPDCRHWQEPRHRSAALCGSPHLVGSRLVTPEFCGHCPFREKTEINGREAIHAEMSVEALAALVEEAPRSWPAGWEDWPVTADAYYLASERFLRRLNDYPGGRYEGQGVVLAGGGQAFFPSLYVAIRALRASGCGLPVQVWYLGRNDEMPAHFAELLAPLAIECIDADGWRRRQPCRILNGWELKVFALIHSPFEEVLLLDADCYSVRDPTCLFHDAGYRTAGAIFWPDLASGSKPNWGAFRVAPPGRASVESGQLVVNKRLCWRPLQLAWWYNDHSDWTYLHGHGDRHTFEVAWARLGAPYRRFNETAVWSRHSYVHPGPDGLPLFIHRCRDKFRFGAGDYLSPQYFQENSFHAALPLETECFTWLGELKTKLAGTQPGAGSASAGADSGDYQGSIVAHRGRMLLAVRRDGVSGAEIHLRALAEDRTVEDAWHVSCAHPLAALGQEDARLFVHQGRLHVSFHGLSRDSAGAPRVTVLLARLSADERRAEDIWAPFYEHARDWEKNWAFFEAGDSSLCCVYSIEPHVVLRVEGEHAYEIGRTSGGLRWDFGQLRGGAPPVRVGDEYYHWFHGARLESSGYYTLGVYTFSAQPPFQVTRFAPRPLLEPEMRPGEKPVVFPCGAMLRDGRWLVSYGHNDRSSRIAEFDGAAVERALQPVVAVDTAPLPTTWCIWISRTAQRLETTRPHLERSGLAPRFWEGFDGRALGLTGTHEGPGHGRMGDVTTGVWLSHRALWEHCLHEPGDTFLILEDDVVLRADFPFHLRKLLRDLPAGWQFCFAGIIDEGPDIMPRKLGAPLARGLHRPSNPYGLHCYLATRAGLKIMLDKLQQVKSPIDIQLYDDALPHMHWYAVWPTLAQQRSQNGEWPSLP
jgi:predicted GH43/DUF377 family glycosyl hydrolase/GR25 family glycosyltransferase involved in LPS biosynthesis